MWAQILQGSPIRIQEAGLKGQITLPILDGGEFVSRASPDDAETKGNQTERNGEGEDHRLSIGKRIRMTGHLTA